MQSSQNEQDDSDDDNQIKEKADTRSLKSYDYDLRYNYELCSQEQDAISLPIHFEEKLDLGESDAMSSYVNVESIG